MVAKDNGGIDDRRDDPSNSGSPTTPSAEGGAEGSEPATQPVDPNPEGTTAFIRAMFERLEEHARTISLQLREDLRTAQDEFMSRMAAERQQREKAFEEEVTASIAGRVDTEVATQVTKEVEARLVCDVVEAQRELSTVQESLAVKLAQLESVADVVGSMQQGLADPRQLAKLAQLESVADVVGSMQQRLADPLQLAKLAQLESVADVVGSMQQGLADPRQLAQEELDRSMQQGLADPRQLAQEELDRLREELTVLRADVGMIQGQVQDMKAHVEEA